MSTACRVPGRAALISPARRRVPPMSRCSTWNIAIRATCTPRGRIRARTSSIGRRPRPTWATSRSTSRGTPVWGACRTRMATISTPPPSRWRRRATASRRPYRRFRTAPVFCPGFHRARGSPLPEPTLPPPPASGPLPISWAPICRHNSMAPASPLTVCRPTFTTSAPLRSTLWRRPTPLRAPCRCPAPADTAQGPAPAHPAFGGLTSNIVSSTEAAFSPAMFMFGPLGQKYVAAVRNSDSQYIGPTNLYPGLTVPAKAGDIIDLYGTGFGPTNPTTSFGETFSGAPPTVNTVTCTLGGVPAAVYQGTGYLIYPGEYQIAITVPPGLPSGDNLIVLRVGGVTTQANAYLTVQ